MMNSMKNVFSVLAGVLILTGCTTPSVNGDPGNLREFDLRESRYMYVDNDVRMDLPTVQRQLYIHREACDVEVVFKKDPMQVHFATVLYGPTGAVTLKDQVMLDLTAYATGKLGVKGYAYYAANKNLVRELIKVLENPTHCPEGIKPNLNPNPYVNMTPNTNAGPKKE